MARPSSYTPERADDILERMANGETLSRICKGDDMPSPSTVRKWAIDDVDGFSARYSRARALHGHALVDQVLDVTDDAIEGRYDKSPEFLRVYVSARIKLAGKLNPSELGDRLELGGDTGGKARVLLIPGMIPGENGDELERLAEAEMDYLIKRAEEARRERAISGPEVVADAKALPKGEGD